MTSTPVLKILHGPPGTGKTYRAAREAVRAIDGVVPDAPDAAAARYRELVQAEQIWPVTFHPSYSYEDFVEGFRPVLREGTVTYEVRDGPFKLACEAVSKASLKQGDVIAHGAARFKVESATREVIVVRPQRDKFSAARKFMPRAVISAVASAIRDGKLTFADLNLPKGPENKTQRKKVADASDINPYYLSDTGLIQALVARELSGTVVPGDVLDDQKGKPKYEVKSVDSQSVVLQSEPDRDNEVAKFQTRIVDLNVIRRAQELGLPSAVFSISAGEKPYELARFGLKGDEPNLDPDPKNPPDTRGGPILRKYFAGLLNVSSTDMANCGHYAAVLKRLTEVGKSGRRRVAIVIDEINRGDLSRIFGELLTLLEPDKREGQPEERRLFLPYSQQWFSVPLEVSVIGTMNTADKSLSVIDFALRRRFEFEEVMPDTSLSVGTYGDVDVRALLTAWNNRITSLRSRDYRVGHAELMPEKLEGVRVANGFADSAEGQRRALAWTIRRKIVPLVVEYFHDEWRKAEAVLGIAGLFVPHVPLDPPSYFEEVADISDSTSFDLAAWADPAGPSWDDQRMLATLKKATP